MKKSSEYTSHPSIKQGRVRGAGTHGHYTVGHSQRDGMVSRLLFKRSQQRAVERFRTTSEVEVAVKERGEGNPRTLTRRHEHS